MVVANRTREVYLYISLRCVARTIHQLMLDGHFRVTDSILIIPKTWPHVPRFEHFRFASVIDEIIERRVIDVRPPVARCYYPAR